MGNGLKTGIVIAVISMSGAILAATIENSGVTDPVIFWLLGAATGVLGLMAAILAVTERV